MSMSQEVTWDGVPLCETYGVFVEGGRVEAPPPAPKLSVVSIPGGDDIDLTEALTGHAAYEDRKVSFSLVFDGTAGDREWQDASLGLVSLLHGRRARFSLSGDPGFSYEGRATVSSVEALPENCGRVSVEITASPWKLREVHTVTVDAVGGVRLSCASGRRPVHPAIVCSYPVTVNWRGTEFVVPAGDAYRLADVVFEQGKNELWLSIHSYETATWADVAGRKWSDLAGTPWSRVVVQGGEVGPDFPGSGLVTLQWEESYL